MTLYPSCFYEIHFQFSFPVPLIPMIVIFPIITIYDIFGTKTKNKTKMKIHFRPKTKMAENDQIAHFRRRRRKRISVGF